MWVWSHARHVEKALEGIARPKKLLERLLWVPVERVTTVWLWEWSRLRWWWWWSRWRWWWWWSRWRWSCWSPPPPPPLLVLSPSSPNLSYTSLFFLSLSTWTSASSKLDNLYCTTLSSPRKHKQYPWTFRPHQEPCSGGKFMLKQKQFCPLLSWAPHKMCQKETQLFLLWNAMYFILCVVCFVLRSWAVL